MKLSIPNKNNLIPLKFEYIDQTIDQYYRPIQGYFMRLRLQMALDLLTQKNEYPIHSILDVGYGGGTFIPSLSRVAEKVYGIDLHSKMSTVSKILKKENVTATLTKDSIFKTKFKTGMFDRIVCLSVLEHFSDTELVLACKEMKRILKKDGYAVIGFPTKNILSNFIIEYILHFKPDDIHPSGHRDILAAISNVFLKFEVYRYPQVVPSDIGLYVLVKAYK